MAHLTVDTKKDIKEVVETADQSVARSLVADIKAGIKAWDTRPVAEAARSLVQGKKRRDASSRAATSLAR